MPMLPPLSITLAQTPAAPATGTPSATPSMSAPPPAAPVDSATQLSGGATSTTTPGGATPAQPSSPAGGLSQMLPMVLMFLVVMFLMTTLTGRRDKKKRESMMNSLGKGDKVVTIGGQIGVIDAVRDNEVVLRIDENSNAKARFTKAAIQQVLESAGKSSEPEPVSGGTVEVKTKGEKLLSAR